MSLGRSVFDLDADLSKLAQKLSEGEQLVRAFERAATSISVLIDADVSVDEALSNLAALESLAHEVGTIAPTIVVDSDAQPAIEGLDAAVEAGREVDGLDPEMDVTAETRPALARIAYLEAEIMRLTDDPKTITLDAKTDQATQGLSDVGDLLDGLPVKAISGAAAIAGAAKFTRDAYNQVDGALDSIRIGTGATGEELRALEGDFTSLGKIAPSALGDIAIAISDINTRLKLTGDPLQDLSQRFLALARLTGGDLARQIALGTRVFGDWSVATRHQGETLDYLFRVSQNTGIGIERLMQQVVQFGAPLRGMGFDLETSAILLGKWEQEGVNAELVLGSLRIALNKFAQEGVADAQQGLADLIERIKSASNDMEAGAIAAEYFGTRAGRDMAAAIREGRFEVDDLVQIVGKSEETILGAAAATDDLAEAVTLLKNQATLAAGGMSGELVPNLVEVLQLGIAISQLEPPWWAGGAGSREGLGDAATFTVFGPIAPLLDAAGPAAGWLSDLITRTDEAALSQEGWNAVLADGLSNLQTFASVVRDAAAAASDELGVTVTAADLKRGYIEMTDGQRVSLEGFVRAAILANQTGSDTASVMGAFAAHVQELLTLSFDGGIGQLPNLLEAIDTGLISSQDAAQALASSMGGDLDAIRDAAIRMRGALIDQRLAASLRGDEEAAAALAGQISVLDRFMSDLSGTVIMLPPAFDEMTDGVYNAARAASTLSGAAAEAARAGVNMHTAWDVLGQAMSNNSTAMSDLNRDIQNVDQALAFADEQLKSNNISEEEHARITERLTWLKERQANVLRDHVQPEFIDLMLTQADYIDMLDDIDRKVKDGLITEEQANQLRFEAAQAMQDAVDPAGNLIESQEKLIEALGTLSENLRTILDELGLLDDARAEPEVDVDTELFERGASLVGDDIIQMNYAKATPQVDLHAIAFQQRLDEANLTLDEFVARNPTPAADLDTSEYDRKLDDARGAADDLDARIVTITVDGDITPFISAMETAKGYTPSSPAKLGPWRTLPDWAWIFTGLAEAADERGQAAALNIARYLPQSPAEDGPLATEPNWGWLFSGIDWEAEDALTRAADAFIGFFGSIPNLISGETMQRAQEELDRLLVVRQLAVDAGLGEGVVAGIDRQIQEQRDRIAAIGFAMGTEIVQGLIDATEAANIARQIVDGLRSDIGSFSLDAIVSGAAITDLQDNIRDLEAVRDALIEIGVPSEALVDINDQIAESYRRLALASGLLETETVQNLIAVADATRAAAEASERLGTAIEAVATGDARALGGILDHITSLQRQIQLAEWAGDIDLATRLRGELDDALALSEAFSEQFLTAIASGLISDEQLLAMAQSGGDAFRRFYDAVFSEGSLQAFLDRMSRAVMIPIEEISRILRETENPGVEFLGSVAQALAQGRTSIEDAMALWADAPRDTLRMLQDEARELGERWNRDLVRAMIDGNAELEADTRARLAALEQMLGSFIDPATAARQERNRRLQAAIDAGILDDAEARLASAALRQGTGGSEAMQAALDKLLAFERAAAEMPEEVAAAIEQGIPAVESVSDQLNDLLSQMRDTSALLTGAEGGPVDLPFLAGLDGMLDALQAVDGESMADKVSRAVSAALSGTQFLLEFDGDVFRAKVLRVVQDEFDRVYA